MRSSRTVLLAAVLAACSSGGGGPTNPGTTTGCAATGCAAGKVCTASGCVAACVVSGCAAGQTCGAAGCVALPALTATITSPAATVFTNGAVSFTFAVTGAPDGLELLCDGVAVLAPSGTSMTWDTTSVAEGDHAVVLRAHRGAEVADSAPVSVVVDRTPPAVTRRTPAVGDDDVLFLAPILAGFSEPIRLAAPIAVRDGAGAELTTTVQLSAADDEVSISLSASPAPGTVTVDLSGVTDRAGNPLDLAGEPAWTFSLPLWESPGGATPLDRDPSRNAVELSLAGSTSGTWVVGWTEAGSGRVSQIAGESRIALGDSVAIGSSGMKVFATASGGPYATWIQPQGNGYDFPRRLGFWSTSGAWATDASYYKYTWGHTTELAGATVNGEFAIAEIDDTGKLQVAMTSGPSFWIASSPAPLNVDRSGASPPDDAEVKLAMSSAGVPLAAFREGGLPPYTPGEIYVKRWLSFMSPWQLECGAGAGQGWGPSLALTPNGAWSAVTFIVKGATATELRVRRCAGFSWEDLPDPAAGGDPVWSASVGLDAAGNPIVAYETGPATPGGGHDGRIVVKRWDGDRSAWVAVGDPLSSRTSANPVIAVDPKGHVAVAWEDGPAGQSDVRVSRLNR